MIAITKLVSWCRLPPCPAAIDHADRTQAGPTFEEGAAFGRKLGALRALYHRGWSAALMEQVLQLIAFIEAQEGAK
jgi:hypothetical protein